MNSNKNDLKTIRDWASHVSQLTFPLYRTVDGEKVVDEAIVVSPIGVPGVDGWVVEHGPFYCMAADPTEWIAFAPAQSEDSAWTAFLTKEARFFSLAGAIDAAVTEQLRLQIERDALTPKGAGS